MEVKLNVNDRLRVKQEFHKESAVVDFQWNDLFLQTSFYQFTHQITCVYKQHNSIYVLSFPSIEYFEEWQADSENTFKDAELIYSNLRPKDKPDFEFEGHIGNQYLTCHDGDGELMDNAFKFDFKSKYKITIKKLD